MKDLAVWSFLVDFMFVKVDSLYTYVFNRITVSTKSIFRAAMSIL